MIRALTHWTVLGAALVVGGNAHAGGDIEAGKKLAETVCVACHGVDGNSVIPMNPKLAGQYQSYLVQALRDYRSGDRKSPIMAGFAASLTDEDIENISAYFAAQDGDLKTLDR